MLKLKKLSVFILLIAGLVSVLVTATLIVTMNTYINDVKSITIQQSKALAQQTFSDMFQIMKTDWTKEQLENFLKSLETVHKNSNTKVYLYRGKLVDELFGKINQKKPSPYVDKVFKTGTFYSYKTDSSIRYFYPLKAQNVCLRCHINAKVGDTLGVIEVKSNIYNVVHKIEVDIFKSLFFSLVVIVAGASFVSFVIMKVIHSNVNKFKKEIENIVSVDDLTKINFSNIDFFFSEINEIRDSISTLVEKLAKITVDKEILEFEIKLLEQFIITSEAIANWQEFLESLLKDIAKLMDFVFFYTIFRTGEDKFESFIFWRCKCEGYKKEVEEDILKSLKTSGIYVPGAKVDFQHILLENSIETIDYEKIAKLSKNLILEKPLVGGSVGIGISFQASENEVKKMAVEALLATILNIIGSIKAINKYTKELEYYATRDPLTNLYNQRVFWELLEYEVERARRHNYKFSLLVIDFDNFKLINDTYGHAVGDNFLRRVARIIESDFRNEDIIARYGGDEFVIIMPYTDAEQAFSASKRLLDDINKFSMEVNDGKYAKATISIGVAVYPDHAKTAKELFVLADNLLYKMKEEGKNGIKLPSDEDLRVVAEEFGKISFLLMETIDKKKVIPYFQPIVDIKTMKPYAYEVLMRIEDNGEILSAYKFIEIAETLGLVYKLDYILIEKAIDTIIKHQLPDNIKIFFNLSPKSLIIGDFIDKVKSILTQYSFPPNRIVFEITERDTIKNIEIIKKFVQALRLEGFSFAIDDFGAGFASYAYIKHFPIDFVKIDGEIVRTMTSNKIDEAFIKSTVTLTKALNMKTIAEFVENEETLQALISAGIDFVQGYYVGKPSENLL